MSLSAYKTWIEADDKNVHQNHKACSTQEYSRYGQADTICDFFSSEINGGCFWGHLGGTVPNGRNSPIGDAIGFQTLPFAKLAWQFQYSECS